MLHLPGGALAKRPHLIISLAVLATSTLILSACPLGDATGIANKIPTSMSIDVTSAPATGNVVIGTTRQYRIKVLDPLSAVIAADTIATWSVTGTAGVATITSNGLAMCASVGTTTIHAVGPANASGALLTADASLQCVGIPASSIVLTPTTLTTTVNGTTTATATFRDATGLVTTNGCPVVFTVSGASGVANVASTGNTATLTGVTTGRTTLRAACSGTTTVPAFLARVQVTAPPQNIARVVMTTRFVRFPISTSATTFRFIATAQDVNGATVPTTSIVWAISGGSAATIDQGGNVTVAPTAGAPPLSGGAVITATVANQVDRSYLTYGDAGTIRGQVTSTAGQDVGGTTAKATNAATGAVTTAGPVTNDGYVILVGLAAGTYTVEITSAEGVKQTLTNVVVASGQITDVTLTPFAQHADR